MVHLLNWTICHRHDTCPLFLKCIFCEQEKQGHKRCLILPPFISQEKYAPMWESPRCRTALLLLLTGFLFQEEWSCHSNMIQTLQSIQPLVPIVPMIFISDLLYFWTIPSHTGKRGPQWSEVVRSIYISSRANGALPILEYFLSYDNSIVLFHPITSVGFQWFQFQHASDLCIGVFLSAA